MVKMQYVLGSGKPRYSKTTTQQVESRCQGFTGRLVVAWLQGEQVAEFHSAAGPTAMRSAPGGNWEEQEVYAVEANLGTAGN